VEKWEVLPRWLIDAMLPLSDGKIARAFVYDTPPAHAPFDIVRKWAEIHMRRKANASDRDS
jgi:hypothetical protein